MRIVPVAIVAAFFAAAAVVPASDEHFVVRQLVSDVEDPQLVNAWGLAATATGPWWVANEARSSSTLYAADGRKQAMNVDVPGGPTGIAYNPGSGFVVRGGGKAAPARFIYACEDGRIRAWTPGVPHAWSTETEVAVDAAASGTIFRGLTLAAGHLYATDFHNARVLVFDERWRPVHRRGAFVDPSIPEWYAPFNIAALGGRLFVSYAWRAPVNGNDAPTGGYVDEFDLDGRLVARVGRAGELNEPWGLALAPEGFGRFGGHLLVANFGTGRIAAFARRERGWSYAGLLPVEAPGVWGIAFGTGGMSGARTTLFFASGPHRWLGATEIDVHGVLGAITLES
jgi:uncharacterized protein (TIGR03118 family)